MTPIMTRQVPALKMQLFLLLTTRLLSVQGFSPAIVHARSFFKRIAHDRDSTATTRITPASAATTIATTSFQRTHLSTTTTFSSSSSFSALYCQLLGMNCAQATEFSVTWPGFCARGGGTDIHADGWGLAYYQGQGVRQFHDTEPASTSSLAKFLGDQRIQTRNMLAHIRYATSGRVDMANVHPFTREMWAMNWCFCHNGQVPMFDDRPDTWLGKVVGERLYYPVGDTDSEKTFCAILNALRAQFTDTMPSLPVLYEKLKSLCEEIVDYDPEGTILNFLLTCGPHVLWVYSWPGQRPGSKTWNGLHYCVQSKSTNLSDDDYSFDVSMKHGSGDNYVCIVATKPLTSNEEEWIELERGELILLDNGLPHVSPQDLFRVELHGHGLNNDGKVLEPVRLEEDMRRFQLEPAYFVGGGI